MILLKTSIYICLDRLLGASEDLKKHIEEYLNEIKKSIVKFQRFSPYVTRPETTFFMQYSLSTNKYIVQIARITLIKFSKFKKIDIACFTPLIFIGRAYKPFLKLVFMIDLILIFFLPCYLVFNKLLCVIV